MIWSRGCCHSSVDSSSAHHQRFFQFILLKLYTCQSNSNVKRTKINKKRPGLAHFLKKWFDQCLPSWCSTSASRSTPQIVSKDKWPCSSGYTSCWPAPRTASGRWRPRWRSWWSDRSPWPRWRRRCSSRLCRCERRTSFDTSDATAPASSRCR